MVKTTGMSRRNFIAFSAAGTLIGAIGLPRPGFAASLGTVQYGVASVDPTYSMIYLAMKNGYFAEAGLDVEYLDSQSGPRSKQMLAAEQIFTTTTGTNDCVAVTLAGKPAVVVAGFDNRVTFANILASKKSYDAGIRTVADLKGKKLAVTQPQAATWLMAVYISQHFGVGDDIEILGLGDFTTMMGAVKSGRVDGCMATFAMIDKARQEDWGFPLFDVTAAEQWDSVFGGPVPGVSCYVLKKTRDERPEQVAALVQGLVKATDFCKQKSAEEIADAIHETYLRQYPRDSVINGINTFKKVWNYDNLVTEEAYNRLIGIMGDGRQYSNEELAKAPYSEVVDMSFVKQARKLG